MNEKDQKILCKKCKTKARDIKCYKYYITSGGSMIPTIESYCIPDDCKFRSSTVG
ncbi:unnamed protein product [marine sediment metagenome]|uniref:Uncharacterized protein n=1 Tax=marine sediment metagenome TaxID=412755 RepID=X1GXD0_9ZZZZ